MRHTLTEGLQVCGCYRSQYEEKRRFFCFLYTINYLRVSTAELCSVEEKMGMTTSGRWSGREYSMSQTIVTMKAPRPCKKEKVLYLH